MKSIITTVLFYTLLLCSAHTLFSQDNSDKKRIRIIYSEYGFFNTTDSGTVNIMQGNVALEHNGAMMRCDSAVLYPSNDFKAMGNTMIISGNTVVRGDTMFYHNNKAEVYGRIVYLTNGSSTLRTTKVDYNTQTEVGYFENEGTILDSFRTIESKRGYYYSKDKLFEFIGQVESDTKDYVLKSDSMTYNTETKVFNFFSHTHIWSEGNRYLYCDKGWYNSDADIMFFFRNSYMLSSQQEIFADSIYYENRTQKGKLYSGVQVADTGRKTIALADFADFDMNTEDVVMHRNPAIIMYNDPEDTIFMRADTIMTLTRQRQPEKKTTIAATTDSVAAPNADSLAAPKTGINVGAERTARPRTPGGDRGADRPSGRRDRGGDATGRPMPPAGGGRRAPANIPSPKNAPLADIAVNKTADSVAVVVPIADTVVRKNADSLAAVDTVVRKNADSLAVVDTIRHAHDSLALVAPDSLAVADTLQAPFDSIYKVMYAYRNVRLYKSDLQLKCDSLFFNDIDSTWRLYIEPILWSGGKLQMTSDSMKFFMKNGDLDKAELMSNAMNVSPEDDDSTGMRYFDQVKAKNILLHFIERKVRIMEAKGNVQTIVFALSDLEMNKTEASAMKIIFNESTGRPRRVSYYTDVNAAHRPLLVVREDEIQLPGFKWQPELRPRSGADVLNRNLRSSEREEHEKLQKPAFPITAKINEKEKNTGK